VASNDSFRQYRVSDDKEVVRGTYTGSGNAVTATITEVNTAIFGGQDRWYTWANLPSEYKGLMGGSQTQQITITGNTFIISGITFTKQNGTGDGGKEGGGKEGGGDAAFEGTWESDDNFLRLEASNGSFTQYMFAPDFFGEFVRGTYTVSGNAVTATITQINTAMFGGADAWVSWANLSDAQKASMGGSATQQITITGNTFTSNGMTFTKKNGTGGEGGGGGSEGGSGGGSGNTLIIGGIPSSMVSSGYSGSVIIGIFPSGTSSEQAVLWTGIVAGADSSNGDVGLSTSGSGSYTATAALYALLPDGTPAGSRWTGSGTFDIYLIVNGSSYYRATSVRFSSGTTTVSVSAFFPVTPGSDQPPPSGGTLTITGLGAHNGKVAHRLGL
jgi:hypothetical protein